MVPLTVCLFTHWFTFLDLSTALVVSLRVLRFAPDLDLLLMSFGSAEVDAEVLYVAGDDEDAFGPAPPAAAAEAKPNTIKLKVVSQYGTEGVLLPPHVPAFVHTNAVAPAQWRPFSLSAGDRQ